MINSCETGFSHVFICFHTPNSPSSYIKLHQLTDIVHNCTMRALHSSSSSKTPLGVEAHSAAGEMELQQLGRSPGALDALGCSGPSWPSWDDWTYSNIFKHIQTTLHSKKSKLTLDIIRHHWTSLDMDSRPYAAYAVGLWKKWTCWGYSNSMPGLAWKKFMRTGWLQQVLNYSSILVQVQKSESKLIYINLSNLCVTYFVSYQIQ